MWGEGEPPRGNVQRVAGSDLILILVGEEVGRGGLGLQGTLLGQPLSGPLLSVPCHLASAVPSGRPLCLVTE